jgi:glycosyltransferase involved in cell wall biosynthesis
MTATPVVQVAHNTQGRALAAAHRGGAALLVVNSEQMAAQFADYSGRLLVVRPPVHATDYAATPAGSGGAITLINLSADKGAETFYALADRFPDRRFLGVKGGYGEQMVRDAPNVEILAHVPARQMPDRVYGQTRILLMPSRHESWGRTAVEAMCSGIPVVAHPTDGLRESLGGAGIFADRADIDAWAAHVTRLSDGRAWRAASRKASKRAAELDPADDLVAWREAVEEVARAHRIPARHG